MEELKKRNAYVKKKKNPECRPIEPLKGHMYRDLNCSKGTPCPGSPWSFFFFFSPLYESLLYFININKTTNKGKPKIKWISYKSKQIKLHQEEPKNDPLKLPNWLNLSHTESAASEND